MSSPEEAFERGPIDEQGRYLFDQERLARDVALTRRVQTGYSPSIKHGVEQPIIEGALTSDAAGALGELWEAYYPAAIKTANRKKEIVQHMPGIEVDDLIHEAYFGLYHSAVTWSPGEITFLTNTRTMMHNYVNRYIRNHGRTVHVPGHVRGNINRANARSWSLYQQQGQQPSRKQLSQALGITATHLEKILATQAMSDQMGSIDRGYFEDDRDRKSIGSKRREGQWKPVHPAATQPKTVEAEALEADLASRVRDALLNKPWNLRIDEREMYILRQRHLNSEGPTTLEDIGEHLNLSGERVRQIESRLLARLRHPSASGRLSHLLD